MSDEVEPHVLRRYNLLKKIGNGAYGHVWRVTDKKTEQVLALKKIFDAFQHSTDAQRTYREIVLLHDISHPNIIRLETVMRAENDKDLYLVFEYMEADLHNAINQKILKDAHQRYIMYQLAKAIKYLHSAEVIHRDLKPSNLLLNSDCKLKICDFGLARSLCRDTGAEDVVLTEEVATRWYRAPQVLLGSQRYDKSADVWSMGCILAEMLIGKPLLPGGTTLNQLQRIITFTGKPRKEDIEALNSPNAQTMIDSVQTKQRPLAQWFKPNTPSDAIALTVAMLQFNPQRRPNINEILRNPYFGSFSKPRQEIEAKSPIHPPISDNTKLNLKQYRQLIYEHIKKAYPDYRLHEEAKPIVMEPPTYVQHSDSRSYYSANSRTQNHQAPIKTEGSHHSIHKADTHHSAHKAQQPAFYRSEGYRYDSAHFSESGHPPSAVYKPNSYIHTSVSHKPQVVYSDKVQQSSLHKNNSGGRFSLSSKSASMKTQPSNSNGYRVIQQPFSPSTNGSRYSTSNLEEDARIKKKNSLNDLLSKKRQSVPMRVLEKSKNTSSVTTGIDNITGQIKENKIIPKKYF